MGRASKAGIEFTIKEQLQKVHFVLDKLNLGAVPQKVSHYELPEHGLDVQTIENKRQERGGILKDITGQELRYLYRNRDNEQIMQNVIFRKKGQRVVPPWKSSNLVDAYRKNPDGTVENIGKKPLKELWEGYKPKEQKRSVAKAAAMKILSKSMVAF
ncbi:hypothetical protein [Wolbachia endosymbiont (group A) of Limnophora tigrina]|uniref:hypothetical protein n=1 Tax=Wolbachia endosymbiont (group A) of Limnophora tigrina TaxID=3139318 RepID=UPI0035B5189E